MAWETRIQSQVATYQTLKKWYLIHSCLTLSIIRYVSRVKWSNPGKRVAPSPTPREKGAFGSPLTTVANFTIDTCQRTLSQVILLCPQLYFSPLPLLAWDRKVRATSFPVNRYWQKRVFKKDRVKTRSLKKQERNIQKGRKSSIFTISL